MGHVAEACAAARTACVHIGGSRYPLSYPAPQFLDTRVGDPMLDFLRHLRWADNLVMKHYHTFGIDAPLLIPPCYAAFLVR